MKKILSYLLLVIIVSSCTNSAVSKHKYSNFFFPYSKEVKIYVYRDVVHGLHEKFFRVYAIEDSKGKHIIVESYSMDGRITEALNYNYDSLTIIDHMVVNRKAFQEKAILMKNGMFPRNENDKTWFASKFPGFIDSTMILSETKRSFLKATPFKTKTMDESKNTISFRDTIRFTQFNPFSKKEHAESIAVNSYFAEGIGLVRFHDVNMKTDFHLEKILTQEEWIRIMQR